MDSSSNEDFVARFLGTPVPFTPVPTLRAPGFGLLVLLMLLATVLVAGKKKRRFSAPTRID